jgi:hypothetical protein
LRQQQQQQQLQLVARTSAQLMPQQQHQQQRCQQTQMFMKPLLLLSALPALKRPTLQHMRHKQQQMSLSQPWQQRCICMKARLLLLLLLCRHVLS